MLMVNRLLAILRFLKKLSDTPCQTRKAFQPENYREIDGCYPIRSLARLLAP
jgi:hypothetical protein